MRLIVMLMAITLLCFKTYAQNSTDELLKQGIAHHDKGEYEAAIRIYDDVIKTDPKNFDAYYEKSFSLYKMGKFDEAVDISKYVLKKFPDNEGLYNIYINYGSSLDGLKKTNEAIRIYKKGIEKFPNVYLLHFNKGITEYFDKRYDDALVDFKASLSINPKHTSSHLYLSYCIYETNRIAALLSLSTFLLLEPEGQRAVKNLKILNNLFDLNVKKEDDKNTTITLTADMFDKKGDDNFGSTEMLLSMSSALDQDDILKNRNIAEKLKSKLEILAEIEEDNKGFFTTLYVPLFKKIKTDGHLETAAYLINASAEDQTVTEWLTNNEHKTNAFYQWLRSYQWTN